jgi:protein associated with RNAse G/E
MITIHKLDHTGVEQLVYHGEMIERTESLVILEARFARERMDLGYVTLVPGDRFVEYFYSDRWYNIFLIFDSAGGQFKGWYCNVTRPARFDGDHIWADDLALDYFVDPQGREFVLDEDEFSGLGLAPEEEQAARAALAELRELVARRQGPFDYGGRAGFTTAERRPPGPGQAARRSRRRRTSR